MAQAPKKLGLILASLTFLASSSSIATATSFRFHANSTNTVNIGTASTGIIAISDGEIVDISMSREGSAMMLELKKDQRRVRLPIPISNFSARDMSFQRPSDEAFPWEIRGTSERIAAAPACSLDWTWFLAGSMAANPMALFVLQRLCINSEPQARQTTHINVHAVGRFSSLN